MKKRILLMTAVCTTLLVITGCTTTKTVTTTDANGNETTTTVESHNGKETTYYENVPMDIENHLGGTIDQLYISMSDNTDWGEDFIPDDFDFVDGETAEGITLTYSSENPEIDILAVDKSGGEVTFNQIDLSEVNGEAFTIVLQYDEDEDSFYAYAK